MIIAASASTLLVLNEWTRLTWSFCKRERATGSKTQQQRVTAARPKVLAELIGGRYDCDQTRCRWFKYRDQYVFRCAVMTVFFFSRIDAAAAAAAENQQQRLCTAIWEAQHQQRGREIVDNTRWPDLGSFPRDWEMVREDPPLLQGTVRKVMTINSYNRRNFMGFSFRVHSHFGKLNWLEIELRKGRCRRRISWSIAIHCLVQGGPITLWRPSNYYFL